MEEDPEESASPTIPALRSATPFSRGPGPPSVPLLQLGLPLPPSSSAGGAPRPLLSLPGKALLTAAGGAAGGRPALQLPASASVPRLNLSPSMRSTLHTRNASAEILAREADRAAAAHPARHGPSLGDLERSALGKGKIQAASRRRPAGAGGSGSFGGGSGRRVSPEPEEEEGEESEAYREGRRHRLLYRCEGLHLRVRSAAQRSTHSTRTARTARAPIHVPKRDRGRQ